MRSVPLRFLFSRFSHSTWPFVTLFFSLVVVTVLATCICIVFFSQREPYIFLMEFISFFVIDNYKILIISMGRRYLFVLFFFYSQVSITSKVINHRFRDYVINDNKLQKAHNINCELLQKHIELRFFMPLFGCVVINTPIWLVS